MHADAKCHLALALRAAVTRRHGALKISAAQSTASTTLENSASRPSPSSLGTRHDVGDPDGSPSERCLCRQGEHRLVLGAFLAPRIPAREGRAEAATSVREATHNQVVSRATAIRPTRSRRLGGASPRSAALGRAGAAARRGALDGVMKRAVRLGPRRLLAAVATSSILVGGWCGRRGASVVGGTVDSEVQINSIPPR